MTITVQTPRSGPYTGDGSTVGFSYGFVIEAETDIVVEVRTIATNALTVKTLTTDYSVSGVSSPSGGTVTFVTAPTSAEQVIIRRASPLEQPLDLQNRGAVIPELLEDQLDALTRIAQEQGEELDRAIKVDQFGVVDLDALTLNLATVAAISSEVATVAGITADISTVNGNAADITTVAGIDTDVTTVAGISADVSTVAADGTDIGIVAGISANVTTVAGISSNVTTVAGISADVSTVAADGTDIGTVATNITNVNTVAGISANVTTVAGISADVSTVAADGTDIGVVAGISSAVTSVAAISADVSAVAAIDTDVTTVADNIVAVQGASAAADAAAASASAAATSETNAALSAAAAALSEANLDLGAIDQTITATAVDVFVYDTSKDSDGGAWRKRVQNKSWYNETLNTTTRGSRREFPSVALLVLEADTLTIYDADDPALPMWMVFETNSSNYFLIGSFTSVSMMNGKFAVGASTTFARLHLTDFISEENYWITQTSVSVKTQGISKRNTTTTNTIVPVYGTIVNPNVNDVAMTVLSGAPTDAATGLAVPTIAVATDAGVSVINDDGTVADSTTTVAMRSVAFGAGDRLFYQRDLASQNDIFFADTYASDGFNAGEVHYDNDTIPYILSGTGADTVASDEAVYFGCDAGLVLIDEDQSTKANGMVAYVTDEYSTGWMQGDIKGAFLSSTDTASLTVGELITNGDNEAAVVSNSSTNMTKVQSSDFAQSGTFSAKYTATGGNDLHYALTQSVAADEYVKLSYWVYIPTAYAGVGVRHIDIFDGSFDSGLENTRDTWVFVEDYREPKGTTWALAIGNNDSENIDGEIFYLDNISVQTGVDLDRSVNSNSLQVNGVITRAPVATGADLVAYSGWLPATSYLEQPYNADLDFGTGDFYMMAWVTTTAAASLVIMERGVGPTFGTQGLFRLGTLSGNAAIQVSENAVSGAFGSLNSNVLITDGSWHFVVGVKDSGVLRIYVDGNPAGTLADTKDVSFGAGTVATLQIGQRVTNTAHWDGDITLARVGAGVPTAAQIKKMYEDEKYLFQENAGAVLTNSTVTALASDPDTNLLHVGGDVGRDEFQGLRRTATTAGAVTSSISAVNKLTAAGKATTVDVDQPAISLRETLNLLRQTAV